MEPLFKQNATVLASKIPYFFSRPKITDVILFKQKTTQEVFLKRIEKIKNDQFYVVGDNRNDSLDSKQLGWIEKKDIMGKVLYVYES